MEKRKTYQKPLVELIKGFNICMTPEQQEQQRRSFAYGNTAFETPCITKELVYQIADSMKGSYI